MPLPRASRNATTFECYCEDENARNSRKSWTERKSFPFLPLPPFLPFLPDALLLLRHLEFGEVLNEIFARRTRFDGSVDRRDLAVGIDVERPPPCELTLGWSFGADDAVGQRDFLVGIREQREVRVFLFSEPLVVFQVVDADHEVRHVELPNHSPALTERVAFGGSTGGEGFREPRQRDPTPLQIAAERIGLAVRARKREVGRLIADFEFDGASRNRAWRRRLRRGRGDRERAGRHRDRQRP